MLFFLHIPKTAGTTFYEVVKNNHGQFLKPKPQQSPNIYLENNIKKNAAIRLPGGYNTAPEILKLIVSLDENIISRIEFIGGHVGYGFHNYIKNNVDYISFIRNPIDRIKSDYREHCKEGRYLYEKLKSNNFSFNYYLKLLLELKLDNLFTRQLAGPYDFFLYERNEIDLKQLSIAKNNALNIKFFNLNNFDEALYFLQKNNNWKYCNYSIKNKSLESNKILNYDLDLMAKVIYYDEILYHYISEVNSKKFTRFQKFKFNIMNKIK